MAKTEFSGPIVSEAGLQITEGVKMQNVVVANTNGTTNVSVFGAAGLDQAITITGVFLISLDTTAGNITVENGSDTVVTIAKGTAAGVLVGGVTLANAAVAAGTDLQVDSSSAGNARVYITYTID
jgi:hypothetical protein